MDLNAIKNRLNQLQTTNTRTSNLWKPQPGQQLVRIVPYKHNKDFPFSELYFYFGIGKPRMIALSNFEESDPILEFASQLRKTGEKENVDLSKKLFPISIS